MGQPTVAVLGTARDDCVRAAAVALRGNGASVTVLVPRGRENAFAADAFPSLTFSGRISWRSVRLLAALRSVGARRIVVVVGDVFAHANVTEALNWWRAAGLLRGGDIYVSFSTEPAVLECFNTVDQRQRLAAAAAVLLVVALTIWFPVVILVGTAVTCGLELAARRRRGWPAGERPGHPASAWPLLVSDPHVGWRLRPVQITARVSTPGATARTIRVTVDGAGQRVTSATGHAHNNRPTIAFYGGSYAFGESLSDEETIPWHASGFLDQHRMLNRAVPGYSALQVLTRLIDDFADQPPAAVVAILDGREPTLASDHPSVLPFSDLGHARFPLTDRCALWWWSERVLRRSRERRGRVCALLTIGKHCARQGIPIVMAVAGDDRTGLGPVLRRCGFRWTTIDAAALPRPTAERLAQHVRAALAPSPPL